MVGRRDSGQQKKLVFFLVRLVVFLLPGSNRGQKVKGRYRYGEDVLFIYRGRDVRN